MDRVINGAAAPAAEGASTASGVGGAAEPPAPRRLHRWLVRGIALFLLLDLVAIGIDLSRLGVSSAPADRARPVAAVPAVPTARAVPRLPALTPAPMRRTAASRLCGHRVCGSAGRGTPRSGAKPVRQARQTQAPQTRDASGMVQHDRSQRPVQPPRVPPIGRR